MVLKKEGRKYLFESPICPWPGSSASPSQTYSA